MTEYFTELEKDKISDGKDLQVESNVNKKKKNNSSHYNENKEHQRQKEKNCKQLERINKLSTEKQPSQQQHGMQEDKRPLFSKC